MRRLISIVILAMLPHAGHAWTAEQTDASNKPTGCADLPYTLKDGDTMNTPQDYENELRRNGENINVEMIAADTLAITIPTDGTNWQHGFNTLLLFVTNEACQKFLGDYARISKGQ